MAALIIRFATLMPYLRTELGGIPAMRTEVLSLMMIHLIEDLASDLRQLDVWIDMISGEIDGLPARMLAVAG